LPAQSFAFTLPTRHGSSSRARSSACLFDRNCWRSVHLSCVEHGIHAVFHLLLFFACLSYVSVTQRITGSRRNANRWTIWNTKATQVEHTATHEESMRSMPTRHLAAYGLYVPVRHREAAEPYVKRSRPLPKRSLQTATKQNQSLPITTATQPTPSLDLCKARPLKTDHSRTKCLLLGKS
jgi:hypothetical protein